MKFIRFETGDYVRSDKLIGFTVVHGYEGKVTVWAENEDMEAKRLKTFDTKPEAQAWLDDFVAKLNAEETTCG